MRTICVDRRRQLQAERAEHARRGRSTRAADWSTRRAARDQRRVHGAPFGVAAGVRHRPGPARCTAMLVTNRSTSDRADHRPGGGVAEQRHQQRHAHEAGVRKRGHQRAEGGVAAGRRRGRRASHVTAIVNEHHQQRRRPGRRRAGPGRAGANSGVLAPKRNSMHGSAKNSTKALRPGIALSGSTPARAAS